MPTPIELHQLNTFDQATFVAHIGHLFEGSPWIVAQSWPKAPFQTLDQLHQELCATMYAANEQQQLALIRAHPDLVGRAALAGTLTPASTGEQAAAGLDRLTPQEVATFGELNQAYHERFGFPFVICARQNKKDSILAGFAARLGNSPQQEIAAALSEIAKIAHLRLHDAVVDG